jgi:hypothetical protein
MADNDLHPDELDLAAHHEEHDVNALAVTRFGIGLALIIMVSMFGLWGLFNYFKHRVAEEFGEAPPEAGVGVNAGRLPPQPRLQATPRIDLQDMRAAEDKILNHYAWVDQSQGVVRIPIDRAMDLLARKGLPARNGIPAPLGSPNLPTQSSGGPILQQPGGPLAPLLTQPQGNK